MLCHLCFKSFPSSQNQQWNVDNGFTPNQFKYLRWWIRSHWYVSALVICSCFTLYWYDFLAVSESCVTFILQLCICGCIQHRPLSLWRPFLCHRIHEQFLMLVHRQRCGSICLDLRMSWHSWHHVHPEFLHRIPCLAQIQALAIWMLRMLSTCICCHQVSSILQLEWLGFQHYEGTNQHLDFQIIMNKNSVNKMNSLSLFAEVIMQFLDSFDCETKLTKSLHVFIEVFGFVVFVCFSFPNFWHFD